MRNHTALHPKFILWGTITLGLFLAWQIGLSISDTPESPFAILSNSIVGLIALVAFVSPKTGLTLLVFQCMYTDEFKRIAVVEGDASMDLVTTILIGPLITLLSMNLSVFMRSIVFKTLRVGREYWYMIGAITILTVAMLVGGEGELGENVQFAANLGIYLTLLPMIAFLLPTMKEWRKFIFLQLVLVLPSAVWGIRQYFYGFTDLEWAYARTGFSQTHWIQMMLFENPRIFGFLGSASAFGCMSLYGTYALYQYLRGNKNKVLFLLIGVIFMIAVVCATQRSMLLIPFIIAISYWLMLSPRKTAIFYVSMAILLILGIVNSPWLLEVGIDKVNAAISVNSGWGHEVLDVSTFSDRLKGWENFMEPSTWSLFGTGSSSFEEYQEKGGHDLINKILIKAGVAGLLAVLALVFFVLRTLHRVVWRAPSETLRKEGAFLLACFVPLLIMNVMGGGNLNTVPINLQTWSFLAGILVFKNEYKINIWNAIVRKIHL